MSPAMQKLAFQIFVQVAISNSWMQERTWIQDGAWSAWRVCKIKYVLTFNSLLELSLVNGSSLKQDFVERDNLCLVDLSIKGKMEMLDDLKSIVICVCMSS